MSKSTRFFEIIQILRAASQPVLARELAELLEVSPRTIYRDIVSLQAMQTPIEGAPGVGYMLRKGYDLPPVNFDVDEAEAVALGLQMIARTGDPGLWRAARRAARKLHEVAPNTRRLVASSWGAAPTEAVDLPQLRAAIRDETKLRITYCDAQERQSARVIWPLVLIYYADRLVLVAWCALRDEIRHFRLDRIVSCDALSDDFKGYGADLVAAWERSQKDQAVSTKPL